MFLQVDLLSYPLAQSLKQLSLQPVQLGLPVQPAQLVPAVSRQPSLQSILMSLELRSLVLISQP